MATAVAKKLSLVTEFANKGGSFTFSKLKTTATNEQLKSIAEAFQQVQSKTATSTRKVLEEEIK